MEFLAQQTLNGLVLGSVYGLYGLGFGLVLANLKVFHVAHAAIFTWGAVFAWLLTSRAGLPMWIVLPVVAVASGLLNVATYFVVIRHLLRRRHTQLAAFISSLGALMFLDEVAAKVLGGVVERIPREAYSVHTLRLGGLQLNTLDITIVVLTAVLMLLLGWLLHRTEWGREARAVAFNREVAALLGTNVDRVSTGVFFLSGAMGGVAATLVAMAFNVISADLGSSYLVIAIAAMVVGGFGSVAGVALGGLVIGLASTYAVAYINTSYRDLVVFVFLLLFLVVRPSGLLKTSNDLDRV
ncbi:branched-chain amino acid ABC transporter permease [Ramlibacter sp.]|uniref:branched-chain amino acid ABC transporter permease n=1 Tax=Ramlibacter sp. TaxID=1917967 RepID=UPI003D13C2A9